MSAGIAFAFDTAIEVLDDILANTPRGECSVGYLCKLARESKRLPITFGDEEVKACIVVAVERGFMEYRESARPGTPQHPGNAFADRPWSAPCLPSSDGTPFLRSTRMTTVGGD